MMIFNKIKKYCSKYLTIKRKRYEETYISEQAEYIPEQVQYIPQQAEYIPDEIILKQWGSSEWVEYQSWIFHKEFMTLNKWTMMQNDSMNLFNPPLITVITPSYNTDPSILKECIYSVQSQAYHNWEMCIADDGSTNEATIEILKQFDSKDNRIKVSFAEENRGICYATNRALDMAKGEYVAFLDHDDRLAVNALFCVAQAICSNRSIDVIYSDRDMLSLRGLRFMHLFKPDWSPELLFSTNYICHLLVYRTSLVNKVGGIHHEFEGSQDYDLILRVMELNPVVYHISKILYHWRQNEQSVSLNHDIKAYAYKAGVLALKHAIKRRGLEGDVSEILDLWRGHYRVKLVPPPDDSFCVVELDAELPINEFVNFISKTIEAINNSCCIYIVFISMKLSVDGSAVQEMVSWLQVEGVGLVTGKIVDSDSKIVHAGMVQRKDGYPLFVFAGEPELTPGYMGVTRVVRNVSAPHPYCFAIKKSLWNELGGFNQTLESKENLDPVFQGPHAMIDLALKAANKSSVNGVNGDGVRSNSGGGVGSNGGDGSSIRTVYTPFAKFTLKEGTSFEPLWIDSDAVYFANKWHDYLVKGDPYYNEHLTLKLGDMGLDANVY